MISLKLNMGKKMLRFQNSSDFRKPQNLETFP